jgi:hypothetical protein
MYHFLTEIILDWQVGPETQLDETVQILIFLVTILEFLPSGMIKLKVDNKFGAINIAQQMSKTGILVVSEYFLQIKQYRTHRRNRNIPALLR